MVVKFNIPSSAVDNSPAYSFQNFLLQSFHSFDQKNFKMLILLLKGCCWGLQQKPWNVFLYQGVITLSAKYIFINNKDTIDTVIFLNLLQLIIRFLQRDIRSTALHFDLFRKTLTKVKNVCNMQAIETKRLSCCETQVDFEIFRKGL